LQEAQAALEKEVASLTDKLATEAKCREGAEQQASDIGQERRQLEAQLAANNQTQAQLRHELEQSQKQLDVEREHSIQSLDSQVRERQADVDRLESLLQSEIAQRRREQSQAESLEKQAAVLTGQIAEKVDEQQRWRQRESELEQCIRHQNDQLANSAAAAGSQEEELNSLRSTIDDLQVIQVALCAQVRKLTSQRHKCY